MKQLSVPRPPHQDHAIIDSFHHRSGLRNAMPVVWHLALSTARPQSSLFSVWLFSVANVLIRIWLRKSRFTLLYFTDALPSLNLTELTDVLTTAALLKLAGTHDPSLGDLYSFLFRAYLEKFSR